MADSALSTWPTSKPETKKLTPQQIRQNAIGGGSLEDFFEDENTFSSNVSSFESAPEVKYITESYQSILNAPVIIEPVKPTTESAAEFIQSDLKVVSESTERAVKGLSAVGELSINTLSKTTSLVITEENVKAITESLTDLVGLITGANEKKPETQEQKAKKQEAENKKSETSWINQKAKNIVSEIMYILGIRVKKERIQSETQKVNQELGAPSSFTGYVDQQTGEVRVDAQQAIEKVQAEKAKKAQNQSFDIQQGRGRSLNALNSNFMDSNKAGERFGSNAQNAAG